MENDENPNLYLDASVGNDLAQIAESSGNGGTDSAVANYLEDPNADVRKDRASIDKN